MYVKERDRVGVVDLDLETLLGGVGMACVTRQFRIWWCYGSHADTSKRGILAPEMGAGTNRRNGADRGSIGLSRSYNP
jgi:hypothetical protein